MSLLDKLERALGRFAIPNLSLYLVIGQVFVLLAYLAGRINLTGFLLVPALVTQGEWWRVFSFLLLPPPPGMFGYIFVAFAWYIFYLMGNALEHSWGTFRFNLFLLLGAALTVAAAFVTPRYAATNAFIAGSVFLAFAYLNPDFELSLFFILPVKIKWLAIITWALNLVQFVRGDLGLRLQIAAPVVTFLVFFGPDLLLRLRSGRRQAERRAERAAEEVRARHVCHVCGRTDRTNPEMDFRYCSKCAGDQCYCPEHIQNHAHVVAPDEAARR
jgi:hypothetical protein